MKFSEEQLKQYAAPLSETENEKCLNAIKMVRDALKVLGFVDDDKLVKPLYEDTYSYGVEMHNSSNSRKVKLFIQGSYANNTNVRTESDVDIAVIQEDTFQTMYRLGVTDENYHFVTAPKPLKAFKDEVQECLENKFGIDVERKNKSIKVHGNSYRKDADTVPCMRYRDYSQEYCNNADDFIGGVVIISDEGERIINFPEQHIANGKKKNNNTNHYYKKMVRIIKKIRYIMEDNSFSSSKDMSSFGLESLLWNIPDSVFTRYTIYRYEFGEIVQYIYKHIDLLSQYKEANGIKKLCKDDENIKKYKAFITDLYDFYQYDI